MGTILSNGIVIGSIYGVVALGLVLIFKSSRTINFAHAETGMIGTFVFFSLWTQQHWPYAIAALIGIAVSGGVGLATRVLLSGLETKPFSMIIGTLGVGGLVLFIADRVWGPGAHFLPTTLEGLSVSLGPLTFAGSRLIVVITSLALALGLFILFRYTWVGLAFRATALDPVSAELNGVNVRMLRSFTWALAGILSGASGILVAPLVTFNIFFMTLLLVRALTAALLAGLTSIPGSLIAGLSLGIAEAAINRATTQPGVPELAMVALMITVLTFRSGGSLIGGRDDGVPAVSG